MVCAPADLARAGRADRSITWTRWSAVATASRTRMPAVPAGAVPASANRRQKVEKTGSRAGNCGPGPNYRWRKVPVFRCQASGRPLVSATESLNQDDRHGPAGKPGPGRPGDGFADAGGRVVWLRTTTLTIRDSAPVPAPTNTTGSSFPSGPTGCARRVAVAALGGVVYLVVLVAGVFSPAELGDRLRARAAGAVQPCAARGRAGHRLPLLPRDGRDRRRGPTCRRRRPA